MVKAAGRLGMAALAVLTGLIAARFFVLPLDDAAGPEFGRHLAGHGVALYLHVGGGVIALIAGTAQFVLSRGTRRPASHRVVGYLYVIAIALAGPSGLAMALDAHGGAVARTGFTLLAVTWVVTSTQAFVHARARDWTAHRRWTTRSVALTFGAVLLRVWMPGLQAAGLDFDAAYRVSAWVAWVPNLVVVELYLHRRSRSLRGAPAAIARQQGVST